MPIHHPLKPHFPSDLQSEWTVLYALYPLPIEAHVFVGLRLPDPETSGVREIDFLILHPELGLIIVEVMGEGVEPRKGHWVRRNAEGEFDRMAESPAELLQAQQNALFRFLKAAGEEFIPRITLVLALPALPLESGRSLGANLPACRILTLEKLRNPFISLRLAVTGGKAWNEWCTTPQAAQYAIGRERFTHLLDALEPLLPPETSSR
jgi:hypothetical protein